MYVGKFCLIVFLGNIGVILKTKCTSEEAKG
jgi:hypothetical protein